MKKTYYKIETSYCHYYAVIQQPYPELHKVIIGAKKKCVVLSIYLNDPDANLDALGHSISCNISGNLKRGKGTQHMLKTAMQFAITQYPHISGKFLFKDASSIQCQQDYRLSLAVFSVLNTGKTWYEKNFNAYPSELQEEYQECIKNFKAVLITKPLLKIKQKQLLTMYNSASSLQSFIDTLKEYDCFLYKGWAESLITRHIPYLYGIEWCIDANALELPKLTIIQEPKKPDNLFTMKGGDNNPLLVAKYGVNDPLLL